MPARAGLARRGDRRRPHRALHRPVCQAQPARRCAEPPRRYARDGAARAGAGLGVNAGHDLSQANLGAFLAARARRAGGFDRPRADQRGVVRRACTRTVRRYLQILCSTSQLHGTQPRWRAVPTCQTAVLHASRSDERDVVMPRSSASASDLGDRLVVAVAVGVDLQHAAGCAVALDFRLHQRRQRRQRRQASFQYDLRRRRRCAADGSAARSFPDVGGAAAAESTVDGFGQHRRRHHEDHQQHQHHVHQRRDVHFGDAARMQR